MEGSVWIAFIVSPSKQLFNQFIEQNPSRAHFFNHGSTVVPPHYTSSASTTQDDSSSSFIAFSSITTATRTASSSASIVSPSSTTRDASSSSATTQYASTSSSIAFPSSTTRDASGFSSISPVSSTTTSSSSSIAVPFLPTTTSATSQSYLSSSTQTPSSSAAAAIITATSIAVAAIPIPTSKATKATVTNPSNPAESVTFVKEQISNDMLAGLPIIPAAGLAIMVMVGGVATPVMIDAAGMMVIPLGSIPSWLTPGMYPASDNIQDSNTDVDCISVNGQVLCHGWTQTAIRSESDATTVKIYAQIDSSSSTHENIQPGYNIIDNQCCTQSTTDTVPNPYAPICKRQYKGVADWFDIWSDGWITDDGSTLHEAVKSCGIVTMWNPTHIRDTNNYMVQFALPLQAANCVGKAIYESGGPYVSC
ncbi:hypothetical protein N7455_005478 [Penicillium solitum]|uniref:uncharacterized protein n=1 Tax=Penicillium solitum TaxID=60172 RepID=UPI0032C3E8D2|nr:hypothetical protein N7455_005478 [Penicillium solitum]